MATKYIPCEVKDEYFSGDKVSIGAAGSFGDVSLQIKFSDMWSDLTKKAVWVDANGSNLTTVNITSQMLVPGSTNTYNVPIPSQAKAYPGEAMMSLKGVIVSGDVTTCTTLTGTAKFTVQDSINESA